MKAANENPYHASCGVQMKSNGKLREITRDVYNEVNKSFKKKTGTEFNEASVKVKELKLTKKKIQTSTKTGATTKVLKAKENSRGTA